jgi:hypothetical protein
MGVVPLPILRGLRHPQSGTARSPHICSIASGEGRRPKNRSVDESLASCHLQHLSLLDSAAGSAKDPTWREGEPPGIALFFLLSGCGEGSLEDSSSAK